MPPPLLRVRTDDRLVIAGATGTGKTTLVSALLLPAVPRSHITVILDPKRDRAWRGIPDVQAKWHGVELRPGVAAFRWPPVTSRDGSGEDLASDRRFVQLLREIWKQKNVLIICDETTALFPGAYTMTSLMGRMIREGRARGIGIWWLMQRPATVPQIVLTEAESWAVFTLRRAMDRKTAANYMGDAVEKPLPQDDDRSHWFWWSRPGMGTPKQLRLTLKGDSPH